jgi:peptidyl-prolyl cis-trans isomerase SurA
MTKVAFLVLSLIVSIIALAAETPLLAQPVTLHEGDKLDAVVAIVGKRPIYKSSIDAQVQLVAMQRNVPLSADSLRALRQQILQSEIDHKVLLAQADKDSVVVTDQEVDERLDQQVKMWVQRLGSEAAVEKQLGKSVTELKLSPELRDRTREQILEEKERQRVAPASATVSRQDVQEFYNVYKDSLPSVGPQVELATIVKLAKPLTNQRERSRAFAESLLDSLHHGADFADLAKRYSEDPSAASGGELGSYFPRGAFVPAFEEAAFKLQPGQVSDVVETDQGFHIIKLIERRGEEIRVAQILVKPTVNALDKQAVRDSLEIIRQRALVGEDFGKLASEFSDDPETKTFGGALGRIRLEDLGTEQRSVVDSLKPGEISAPIQIAYPNGRTGFQIVKLVRQIPSHNVNLQEDYRDLEATAGQWKQMRDFQRWLSNARKSVYVDIRDLAQYY